MTENPGTRASLQVSDRVKVHAEGTSVFVIVNFEGEDALIESVDEAAPGRFPFHCKLSRLVPAES